MFGFSRTRQLQGRPITSHRLNKSHKLLHEVSHLRGGRGTFWSSNGTFIAQPGTSFRIGLTSSSGIPARSTNGLGSGDVTIVSALPVSPYTTTLQTFGDTFIGYNLSHHAVAGSAYTIYLYMEGIWMCIWEDCP